MRTIKFRGKSNSGKWVYGSLVCTEGQQPQIYFPIFFKDNPKKLLKWDWVYVDPKTVGQYIGICDTSTPPKEIYDGDIIEDEKGIQHLIQYNEKDARYEAVLFSLKWSDYGALSQSWVDEFKKRVIGNKFDNPELIKKED